MEEYTVFVSFRLAEMTVKKNLLLFGSVIRFLIEFSARHMDVIVIRILVAGCSISSDHTNLFTANKKNEYNLIPLVTALLCVSSNIVIHIKGSPTRPCVVIFL